MRAKCQLNFIVGVSGFYSSQYQKMKATHKTNTHILMKLKCPVNFTPLIDFFKGDRKKF